MHIQLQGHPPNSLIFSSKLIIIVIAMYLKMANFLNISRSLINTLFLSFLIFFLISTDIQLAAASFPHNGCAGTGAGAIIGGLKLGRKLVQYNDPPTYANNPGGSYPRPGAAVP